MYFLLFLFITKYPNKESSKQLRLILMNSNYLTPSPSVTSNQVTKITHISRFLPKSKRLTGYHESSQIILFYLTNLHFNNLPRFLYQKGKYFLLSLIIYSFRSPTFKRKTETYSARILFHRMKINIFCCEMSIFVAF